MKNYKRDLVDGTATIDWSSINFEAYYFADVEFMPFEGNGKLSLSRNGSFVWTRTCKKKSESKLIKKLNHGRLSLTKDGFILLTIKLDPSEPVSMPATMLKECFEAVDELELFKKNRL